MGLRKPFLLLAMLAIILVVLVELGSGLILGGADASGALGGGAHDLGVDLGDVSNVSEPPGRGIAYLALIDVIALYTTGLFTLSLIVPDRVQGRVQGVATLIGSIILIIVSFVLAIIAFVELMIMVSLFLAPPFGTIVYLAIWGFFPVGKASVIIGLLFFLKLCWAVLLLVAQPRFLQNKGLVALVVTTLVCNIVLEFLHDLLPVILVSILDDIGAIVFAVVAIVWGIVLLVGSIPSIVKAVRVSGALVKSAS
ncbi:membrane protein [Hamadaea tsunoensis]|uniref:membrane protein n=1 Tax=Hamadaea tsunoensis TaxID=53368 RepID=UPI00042537B1|nr:membrane protein [Hamadaea tsunoensis]